MVENDVEYIDIDNRDNDYSNEYIAVAIKDYFKSDAVQYTDTGVENSFDNNCIRISTLISYLTDEELLNRIISFFKSIDYLKDAEIKFEKLKKNLIIFYSDIDLIKIKAIVYSLYSTYDIWMKTINPLDKNYSNPLLIVKINDRVIEHNLPHILNLLVKKNDLSFIENMQSLPISEQIIEINKNIRFYRNNNHIMDTDYFSKSIDYLIANKDTLTENKTNADLDITPKHEHVFYNNGFELFEDILSEYVKPKGVRGRFSDISYYYWRMFNDGYIHKRPEGFKTWFFNTYDKEDLGKIKTLLEVKNIDRETHYSNVLDLFKRQQS